MRYDVDADIRSAATLPAAFYRDAEAYADVRERVFARTWQWLGPLAALGAPNSLAPVDLLPGLVDEPLLLARDGDGTLRCLSNVCTHRANLLVRAPCRADHIRCGYHARRFDLAGRMTHMPGFAGARDFPSARDDLPQVPLATWQDHAFAALAPAMPFADVLAGWAERIAWLPVSSWRHDPARDRDFTIDAHWALYVENYLEGLHIPHVHASLHAAIEPLTYTTDLCRYASVQWAAARPGTAALAPPPGAPDHGRALAAYYVWVFPNLMLNVYPWGLSVNLVLPQGPSRTRVLFCSFVGDAQRLDDGAGSGLDRVEAEDEAVVEAVQRGVRARLYRGGRYAPQGERGVHHFHRLLGEFLRD
ncbi:MAG: aromatic ring-hydroxylating dioxygenase subunit alpha [Burkholderiales bacterium]